MNDGAKPTGHRRRFMNVAGAGVAFQAGSAAVDSGTIMSALVWQLSGSSLLVGSVTAILRFGWLFPQLIVGYLAGRGGSSMRYYMIGAYGRAMAMALMALVLWMAGPAGPIGPGSGGAGAAADMAGAMAGAGPRGWLTAAVMGLWVTYAFVSGIVGVPYNDIVARAVPSHLRSRLLATRFFGGGLLALGVAALADRMVATLPFPTSYAAIIAMAAALMFLSATVFTAMGEPEAPCSTRPPRPSFAAYLREGIGVFRTDARFRAFVIAQWFGGAVLMAAPFYVVAVSRAGVGLEHVALLLGAQTAGALLSNLLWGWWGDHLGKASLLRAIAFGRIWPALAMLLFAPQAPLMLFIALFFLLGALANGLTIAVIGFLMEISPEDDRPAWSGYFNAMTAPAFLLPLLAGVIAAGGALLLVFALSAGAALAQFLILMRIRTGEVTGEVTGGASRSE